MITIKEVKDPWFNLRQNLYKNAEPLVELLGITTMFETEQDLFDFIRGQTEESRNVPIITPDRIPGHVASMSHMSEKTPEGEVKLTKNLLKMKPVPHLGPFEFMQWVFKIQGVSKSCLTQFDRHRIGAGFVQMSKRYMDANRTGYVYETLGYLDDIVVVEDLLNASAAHSKASDELYNYFISKGATKEDARKRLPVNMATGTWVHLNTTSLRHFFTLRLDSHAEWEIRRMANLMYTSAQKIAPAHFTNLIEGVE